MSESVWTVSMPQCFRCVQPASKVEPDALLHDDRQPKSLVAAEGGEEKNKA